MPSYTLLVQRVGRPDEVVTFDKPTIVIGREAGDLVMGDGQVSSRHAEISYQQGKLVFRDLGSTNGSFREDGQRITGPVELAIGQSVRLGQCRITVRGIEGATAPGRTVVAGGPPRAPRGTMMMTPGQIPPPGARRPAPPAGGHAPPPPGHAPPPPAGHAPPPPPGHAPPPPPGHAPPPPAGHAPPPPAAQAPPPAGYAPSPPAPGQPPAPGGHAPPQGAPPSSWGTAPGPAAAPPAAPTPSAPAPGGAPAPGWGQAPPPQGPPPAAPPQPGPVGSAPPPAAPGGAPPAAVAPTAPVPVADPAAPAGAVATSIDDVGSYFRFAWEAYRANFLDGFMTVGVLAIPVAIVNVAFGWIPLVGALVGLLLALVELALSPLSVGAVGRWAVSVAGGHSLSWKAAWRSALGRGVADWLNLFVISLVVFVGFLFLIVPGILLGVFALPAYLVERRTFVSANLRSLELVQKNLVPVLVVAIAAVALVVPLAIAVGVTSAILGFIPVVGPPIAQALSVALSCLVMPYVTIMWARLYIDARAQFEQADAMAEIAACHAEWSGGRALESA